MSLPSVLLVSCDFGTVEICWVAHGICGVVGVILFDFSHLPRQLVDLFNIGDELSETDDGVLLL